GNVAAWDASTGQRLAGPPPRLVNDSRTATSPDGRRSAEAAGNLVRLQHQPDFMEAWQRRENRGRERLQRRPQADSDWHQAQFTAALEAGDDFCASFHAKYLLRQRPWDDSLHLQRAQALARLGRREEAVTHLMHAFFFKSRSAPRTAATAASSSGG